MKNTSIKKICTLFCLITMIALFIPCAGMGEASAFAYPYGVFLGITDNLAQFGDYEIVVIDAQYFSGEEIERFRNEGHQVYTYLNIGSLEDFRDYYEEYKDLSLGEYEHWEEEVWVDVSSRKWQDLILQELVPGLLEKQVDGFFVDNCDVYYEYPEQKILDGLGVIMQELVATGKEVIINSGDCFMDAWCEQGGMWDQVITGINQESVFSSMNTSCPTLPATVRWAHVSSCWNTPSTRSWSGRSTGTAGSMASSTSYRIPWNWSADSGERKECEQAAAQAGAGCCRLSFYIRKQYIGT